MNRFKIQRLKISLSNLILKISSYFFDLSDHIITFKEEIKYHEQIANKEKCTSFFSSFFLPLRSKEKHDSLLTVENSIRGFN